MENLGRNQFPCRVQKSCDSSSIGCGLLNSCTNNFPAQSPSRPEENPEHLAPFGVVGSISGSSQTRRQRGNRLHILAAENSSSTSFLAAAPNRFRYPGSRRRWRMADARSSTSSAGTKIRCGRRAPRLAHRRPELLPRRVCLPCPSRIVIGRPSSRDDETRISSEA